MNSERKATIRIFIYVILLLTTIIILRQSPLHPWVNKDIGTDSSVFKVISMQMRNGLVPYRDTFDHKGPLLYLINYLGDMIATYKGVWVIEVFFIWITLISVYELGLLYCHSVQSLIVTLASGSLLMAYFSGGNLCKEYAMPFIGISLYIFTDYFKNTKITIPRLIICGACFSCVLLLRPNMIAVWGVGCIAVLILQLRSRRISQLVHFLLWFLIGMAIVLIPILTWLGINSALLPCYEDYIAFNFSYSSGKILGKFIAFFYFSSKPITIVSIIVSILLIKLGNNEDKWLSFSMLMGSLLSVCVSGLYSGADSYGLVLVPVISLSLHSLMGISLSWSSTNSLTPKRYMAVLLFTFCLGLCANEYAYWTDKTIEAYNTRGNDNKSQVAYYVCNLIENNTSPDDKISVFGNWNIIYLMSNRLPATKYSYQWPIAIYKDSLYDEYYQQLATEFPKAIVIWNSDDRMSMFLDNNNYKELGNLVDGDRTVHVYGHS